MSERCDQLRCCIKQNVKKRNRTADNIIKYGAIALVLAGLYYVL